MDDEIEVMINDCLSREKKLTSWEREFISSVHDQFSDKGSLSERQKDKLDKIWDKVTSR